MSGCDGEFEALLGDSDSGRVNDGRYDRMKWSTSTVPAEAEIFVRGVRDFDAAEYTEACDPHVYFRKSRIVGALI